MHAIPHTMYVRMATATTTGAEPYKMCINIYIYVIKLSMFVFLLSHAHTFVYDLTSITFVLIWICIAPSSSLKDQDLEPKTKRWLLLKRQVQEEALSSGPFLGGRFLLFRLGGLT